MCFLAVIMVDSKAHFAIAIIAIHGEVFSKLMLGKFY
jgi:hypothetical protein